MRIAIILNTAMREMSRNEWMTFLAQGTRTAMVATVRKDGRPHVVPIWFLLDGDDLVFTTGGASVKGHALRRDPRVCLCIDDPHPPYAFVMVDGTASLSTDHGDVLSYATAIAARYEGEERALELGRRNAPPGELLVRVTPVQVLAIQGMTD